MRLLLVIIISIESSTSDETGQLVYAFNRMTRDLMTHRKNSEDARRRLQKNNEVGSSPSVDGNYFKAR